MSDIGTHLTLPAATFAVLLQASKPCVYLLHRAGWMAGFAVNGIYVSANAVSAPQGSR